MSKEFLLQETGAEVSVVWRIERFLSRPKEQDYWLGSPTFSLSDAQWFLRIWTNGSTQNDSVGWISLFLHKKFSTSKKHAVKYTLGIRGRDGTVFKSFDSEYEYQSHIGCGRPQFVLASELKQSRNVLSADGTLTVFATCRLAEPTILDECKIVDVPRDATFRVMRPEEVSFEWKVEGFTSFPKEQSFSLKSPAFSLAGAEWCLQLYPNGLDSDHVGWVSLMLRREHPSPEKQAVACCLGIRKRNGTPYRLAHFDREFLTIWPWGCLKFLKSSELSDSECGLVYQGSITLFCIVRVYPSSSATVTFAERGIQASSDLKHNERASQTTVSEHEEAAHSSVRNLLEQLKSLVANGHHGDVTFKVNDHSFQAHRSILATRSPVFFGMFENDTEEKRTGIVTITDFQPDTVRILLSFLYTGDVAVVTSSNAVELYKVAHKYDIQDLKDAALRLMTRELSSEVFFDVVVLASVYEESELLKAASTFFVQNVKLILAKPAWVLFMEEYSLLANELLHLVMNEKL